ncbi:MAG: extracellular solute-binding protein, partial [Planctomycetota bacterium]
MEVPSALATAPWDRATRAVFDEFVREHPEVNVVPARGVAIDAAGGSTGGSKGLLGIAGGVSPDVFSLFFARVHSYIDQRFVAPLDEYIDEYELAGEIPPQLWPVVTGDDGKRYGAIYTWPTLYLVYRRDLFEQVGLDPDRPPRTWDELYEYAKRLSDPEMIVETAGSRKAGLGRMGLFLQTSGSWIFPNFVWQAGGEVVRRRDDGKWEARFDSPEAVRALEFWKRLRWQEWERNGKTYKGVVRIGYGLEFPEYALVFARGEVAMTIMPLRRLQNVLSLRIVPPQAIGVAPLPAGPTGIRASIVDGDAYCITSRFAGDKRKMDAAWKYIEFVTGRRAREIETRFYVEEGYGKFVRNPDWLKEFGYQEYYDEISPQHIEAFHEALLYGKPEPYCPDYDAMRPEIDLPISRILNDPDANPHQELAAAVKRINTHFFKLHPETEMRRKRRAGLVVAIVLAAAVASVGYFLVKSIANRVSASRSSLQAAL